MRFRSPDSGIPVWTPGVPGCGSALLALRRVDRARWRSLQPLLLAGLTSSLQGGSVRWGVEELSRPEFEQGPQK